MRLIDADALKRRLNDWCDPYHKGGDEIQIDILVDMIDEESTVFRWISVKERLPERSGSYLVMANWPESEESVMSIVNYDEDAEAFGEWHEDIDRDTLGSLGSEFYSVDVTHWMTLPDMPEVEE